MRKFAVVFMYIILCLTTNAQDQPPPIPQGEALNTTRKALSFYHALRYDSAIHNFLKASELWKQEGSEEHHFRTRILAAEAWHRFGEPQKAIESLNEVISDARDFKGLNIVFEAYINLGYIYTDQSDIEKSLEVYEEALEHFENPTGYNSRLMMTNLLIGKGVSYSKSSNLLKARDEFLHAIAIYDSLERRDNNVALCYSELAIVSSKMGLLNEAIDSYEKTLDLRVERFNDPEHPQLIELYNAMGRIFLSQGLLEKASLYLGKALRIEQKHNPTQGSRKVQILLGMAEIEERKGNSLRSLEYKKTALANSIDKFGIDHIATFGSYESIGSHHLNIEDYAEALRYFDLSLAILEKNVDNYVETQRPFLNVKRAICHLQLGHDQKAHTMLEKALKSIQSNLSDERLKISETYLIIGDSFLKIAKADSALKYHNLAIELASPETDKDQYNLLSQDLRVLFPGLISKAKSLQLFFQQKGGQEELLQAFDVLIAADRLVNGLRQNPNNYSDFFHLQSSISELNSIGIKLSEELHALTREDIYLDKAFYFLERNKGNLILDRLNASVLHQNSSIPDSLLERSQDLEASISHLESEIHEAASSKNSLDSSKAIYYQDQLFELRLINDSIVNQIKSSYPSYYEARFDHNYLTPNALKRILHRNELLIEYHLVENTLYTFLSGKKETRIQKKHLDNSLQFLVQQYISLLQRPSQGNEAISELHDISLKLRMELLPSNEVLNHYESLILVPDGILALLPFETLLLSEAKEGSTSKDLDYLLKSHSVTYASSATLLAKQTDKKADFESTEVLAFAPIFEDNDFLAIADSVRDGLGTLAWTQSEVTNIQNFFESRALLGQAATERQFRQLSSGHPIIHVASHGLLNEEDPMYSQLVFSPYDTDSINDGFLSTKEIFNMNIPADMVVLSACNTGTGEVMSGEGVLSLASGFFYAGAKSLAMTLWTANDQSTANIVNDFYKNLADGQTKGDALRSAKLSHLENADALTSHPYYWAHMVINGNNDPIVQSSKMWIYLIIAGLLIGAIIVQPRMKTKTA